jgi:tRNA pseudouridine(55) synthase
VESGSIKNTYLIHKRLGETPLEALLRLRVEEHIPDDVPMTYAGRLDPAAEGLLIILTGEECKQKDTYTGLAKTYEAEILLGVSTDTYDLLGMPVVASNSVQAFEEGLTQTLDLYLKSKMGKQTQTYPPYSSKTVGGKQLHTHAKEGTIVELPTHEVSLDAYTRLSVGSRTREEILTRVHNLTEIVTGDFRQGEICAAWTGLAERLPAELCSIKVTLTVSSGFYIRQLAEDIGVVIGTGACLYSLTRVKIGEWSH